LGPRSRILIRKFQSCFKDLPQLDKPFRKYDFLNAVKAFFAVEFFQSYEGLELYLKSLCRKFVFVPFAFELKVNAIYFWHLTFAKDVTLDIFVVDLKYARNVFPFCCLNE
jgi:hypothetical protein